MALSGRLFARVGPTEAKCLLRALAILIRSLVTFSETKKVIDLPLFDLRASMLLIPFHDFFHISQVRIKEFKVVLLFTYTC